MTIITASKMKAVIWFIIVFCRKIIKILTFKILILRILLRKQEQNCGMPENMLY